MGKLLFGFLLVVYFTQIGNKIDDPNDTGSESESESEGEGV